MYKLPGKTVYLTGLPRSGSTYVWQLLNELIEPECPPTEIAESMGIFTEKIGKMHALCLTHKNQENIILIGTMRHPLQALSSWFVAKDLPLTPEEIEKQSLAWKSICRDVVMTGMSWTNFHLLVYEEFKTQPGYLFDKFETIFGVIIPGCVRDDLTAKYSLASNETISKALGTFDVYDPKTLIHGNHITHAKAWQEVFPQQTHEVLLNTFKDELAHFQYKEKASLCFSFFALVRAVRKGHCRCVRTSLRS